MENSEGIGQSPESKPPIPLNSSALAMCLKCEKEHSGEDICANRSDASLTHNGDSTHKFVFKCVNCNDRQEHQLVGDPVDKISQVLWQYDKNHGLDNSEEVYFEDESFNENQDAYEYDDEPIEAIAHGEVEPNVAAITYAQDFPDKKVSRVNLFKDQIKKIDKNLSEADRVVIIRNSLSLLVGLPKSDVEVCLKLIKDEFGLHARQIEAFRKDFNGIKAQIEAAKKQEAINQLLEKYEKKPKMLSEQEKEEALAFLRDPNLIQNISRDLTFAGEIIGEETNKMMLYFSAISRKFEKPISVVIFGKSSSGKSHLVNSIAKFIPDEDNLILSSSTARAFDYLENLSHKFILVQEYEGVENILPTIRVIQSEGKLSRLVSVKNPEDSKPKAVAVSKDCPCTVVFTTTRETIHDENSTRIFELYADDTTEQNTNVVRQNILRSSLKFRNSETEIKRIIELHQNAQRLLEPLRVDIPFAEHLTFPAKSTRNRRDSERFLQLIKAVAFLRQKQKRIKEFEGNRYIEADDYDYQVAYSVGLKIIAATLDHISDRARNVLRVCCELTDDLKKNGLLNVMTVNQIQEKAPALGFDFSNRQDLYKQLDELVEYEYLSLDQPKFKGTKYYTVIFRYARDEKGELMNISAPEIKEITTPDQLREKLLPN